MKNVVYRFLNKHYDSNKPVLLGLSGGPDSLVLLDVLLKYQDSLSLGIAHVDHGWRSESGEEAAQLQTLAKKLSLPFHLKRLDPKNISGNLEAGCREERLNFFRNLCQEHGYQAVLLAHHADDQAETVLKKFFEGSSLPYLSGMQPITQVDGLILWRPMLEVTKKEILDWIKSHHLKPFEDVTNFDTAYLRGRFRTRIIPQLSEEFGKEISPSLRRLSQEAQELKQYMDERLHPYLIQINRGPHGIYLDQFPESLFEIKYLVRKLCESENFCLSHDLLKTAAHLIQNGAANRKVEKGNHTLFIDRGQLFIVHQPIELLIREHHPLLDGSRYGPWKVSIKTTTTTDQTTDWKSVWSGKIHVNLPKGDYTLGPPVMNGFYPRTSPLNKWWNNHKVPAFLRHAVPVIWEGSKIQHEFLTGKTKDRGHSDCITILLTLDKVQLHYQAVI